MENPMINFHFPLNPPIEGFSFSNFRYLGFKLNHMPLLVNLNEHGYLQIKEDRSKIKKRIKTLTDEVGQLQVMLEEFDDAYNKLKDFYDPTIRIRRVKSDNKELYHGEIRFKHPKPATIRFNLGNVTNFKGDDDKNLIALAEKKGREKIRKEFPLYFL